MHEGDTVSRKFYTRLEQHKVADMQELNSFYTRVDVTRYTEVLKKQLGLFGAGIVTSLERTMGHYLKVQAYTPTQILTPCPTLIRMSTYYQVTSGIHRNELLKEWEIDEVAHLLCTNNPGERPFAVAKAYLAIYASMDLATLAKFSLSVCNGSHRMAGPKGKQNKTKNRMVEAAGIAITSD